MTKLQPVIKWTGSKRGQAERIVSFIPDSIETYYEPFVGGASVLYRLLNSNKSVKKYVCSDVNSDLINFFNTLKYAPDVLFSNYKDMWAELNKDSDIERKKQYYYQIRSDFNKTRDAGKFLFLSRTCTNGLIRYNNNGDFNNSFHFSRDGIKPESLRKVIMEWSKILNEKDVSFKCQSYDEITTSKGDFIYLDPPYANTKGMYFGNIDHQKLWEWMRNQNANYILSFNGVRGDVDNTQDVPNDLYKEHLYINNERGSFFSQPDSAVAKKVSESLYLNIVQN